MASRIFNRKRTERTTFRKLIFGARYWLASARTVAPTVKSGRRSSQGGETVATGVPTNTAVSDTSVAVVKVPPGFFRPTF